MHPHPMVDYNWVLENGKWKIGTLEKKMKPFRLNIR